MTTLALATLALAVTLDGRRSMIVLESEHGMPQFGMAIAASGPRVVTIDGSSEDVVLRIDHVDEDRVRPEARISLGPGWKVPALAMRSDMIVVNHAEQLLVFTHDRGRWRLAQRDRLPAECIDAYFDDLHLGDGLLVVESRSVWCVFERTGESWSLASTLPHAPSTTITTSGSRIVIVGHARAVQHERTRDGWRPTRTIEAPADLEFGLVVAATDRAIVLQLGDASTDDQRVHVYDLEAGGKLVVDLPLPGGRTAGGLALTGEMIVATDEIGATVWRFGTSEWQWLEVPSAITHFAAIGDLIWIGAPVTKRGGFVLGFAHR